jgi:glycerophosphoryl diester phosphodiesterase
MELRKASLFKSSSFGDVRIMDGSKTSNASLGRPNMHLPSCQKTSHKRSRVTFKMKMWLVIAFLATSAYLNGTGSSAANATKSIAHRGNSLFAPENTLAAFVASSNRSDLVELDVQVSLDGTLVVIHDSTVDRTTDGTGAVNAFTLSQLKTLDAGSWYSESFAGETIPTLTEAVQSILTFAVPLIERKAGTAQSYVDALQTIGASSNVVIQSFDWNFLANINALDPHIPLAALGGGALTSNTVTTIKRTGANTIAWQAADISITEIDMVHSLGMDLFVWTVNGPAVQSFVDLEVGGLISNDPALVRYLTDDQPSENQSLAAGLISYWNFDDGLADDTATNALDVEAVNPGHLQGFDSPPSWVTGAEAKFNGALDLDGINDHVDIPQSPSLDINSNAVTISCWLNMSSTSSSIQEDFGGIYDSEQDAYILYQDRGNGELRFKVTANNNQSARPGISESDIVTGHWHHVAAVYNGNAGPISGQAAIYLDGRLKDIHTGADGNSNVGLTQTVKTGQHAAIGRNGASSNSWFSGRVDDIAIWQRALSYGELLQIFQTGTNGASLQKSVMSICISDFSAESNRLRFLVQVDHGSLITNEITLQGSHHLSGPFTNDGNSIVQNIDTNEFRIFSPVNNSTSTFFRIMHP